MEDKSYFQYTTKSRLDKEINTLIGLLEGIAADRTISAEEMGLLTNWVDNNKSLSDCHPYNEIVPAVIQALADGKFMQEEQADLLWLCNQLRSTEYYDVITADVQRLQGILAAIASDGVITEAEVESLQEWIEMHTDLRSCWPYDELDSLLTSVLVDHWIDPAEHKMLLNYFSSFSSPGLSLETPNTNISTLPCICSVNPEIIFDGRRFCFTGESNHCPREEMKSLVLERNGLVISAVSPRLNYLVVGAQGNPCWAYACYGRKIEKAMQLRQQGAKVLIVHENDFFDAVQ
jgi:NAD-dependent DNA ligase